MYSVDEIKELLAAFNSSKATALDIQIDENQFLSIRQKNAKQDIVQTAPTSVEVLTPIIEPAAKTVSEEKKSDGTPIESPMVGVFYAAPSPDSEPYVSVGSTVKKGDVVCIIEAMKLMNEVTAEKSGVITEICVENGQVVEYGQPLFFIK